VAARRTISPIARGISARRGPLPSFAAQNPLIVVCLTAFAEQVQQLPAFLAADRIERGDDRRSPGHRLDPLPPAGFEAGRGYAAGASAGR
jgi:hypothetical protein